MTGNRYFRRHLEVQALRVDLNSPVNFLRFTRWAKEIGGVKSITEHNGIGMEILTNEGKIITAKHGEWIVRGVNGEFWKLSDEEFNTYYT